MEFKLSKKYVIFTFVIVLSFLLKLFLITRSDFFPDFESYDHLSAIVSFSEDGSLIVSSNPLFYILFGYIYSYFDSIFAMKFLLSLIYSLVIGLIYLISCKLNSDILSPIISVIFVSSMPIFFFFNQLNPDILTLLLILLQMLFVLNYNYSSKMWIFILLLTFALVLTGFGSLLYLFVILGYVFFQVLNGLRLNSFFREYSIFLSFFVTSVFVFLYYDALSIGGISTLWNNVPASLLPQYFDSFSLTNSFWLTNVAIIIFGLYSIYRIFSDFSPDTVSLNEGILLLISAVMVFSFSMIFYFSSSFMVFFGLGIFLSIISVYYLSTFISHAIDNFKVYFAPKRYWILFVFFILFSGLLVAYLTMPSQESAVTRGLIDKIKLLNESSLPYVLAVPEYGGVISFYSHKMPILDSNYFMDSSNNLEDIQDLYTYTYFADGKLVMSKITNFDSIVLFDSYIASKYNVTSPKYFEDPQCFRQIFEGVHEYICK